MFAFKALAFVSVVLAMGWMCYFFLGGAPLFLVKFTEPNDSRLVRGFFDVHYLALMGLTTAGCLCFLLAERMSLATVTACVATYACCARQIIVKRMERLRSIMIAPGAVPGRGTIRSFRRLQLAGFLLNLIVLTGLTWAVTRPSMSLITCVDVPSGCQAPDCRHQCSL